MFVDTSSIAYEVRLREVEYDGRGPAVGGRGRGRLATPVLQQSRPALRLVRRDVVGRPHSAVRNVRCCPPSAPHSAAAVCPRAGTIDDSENRESIQNLNFQVNREPTIRQNGAKFITKGIDS